MSKFSKKHHTSNKCFKSYIEKTPHFLQHTELTLKEFESAFSSLKIDKSPGYDDISSNIIHKCYEEIKQTFSTFSITQ